MAPLQQCQCNKVGDNASATMWQCQHENSINASATMAMMQAQQGYNAGTMAATASLQQHQRGQCNDGNSTIAAMEKRPAKKCSYSTHCEAQRIVIIISPSSSMPELLPPCPPSSNSHHNLPLHCLCCRLPHLLFLWLIVVWRADGVWHCWCCHCLSDCCCLLLSSPCPPHQERRVEMCKEGRGCAGNCLSVNTAPLLCCGRAGKASKRMYS